MRVINGACGVDGAPAVVLLMIDAKPQVLSGDFGWGKGNPKGAALAKAILTGMGLDEQRAIRLHRRFLWRVIVNWSGDKPFTITGEEVAAVVAEIEATESLAANVQPERPPVAHEGGIGVGGVAFSEIENKG